MLSGTRFLAVSCASLLCACASTEDGGNERRGESLAVGGAREAVRAFVRAVDELDAPTAADLIAWDLWVAEDAQLQFLAEQLRNDYASGRLTPKDLARRPIQKSTVTVGEILEAHDTKPLLARAARERFEVEMLEDFAPDVRTMEPRLLLFNDDPRDLGATVLMPAGEVVEIIVLRRGGAWKLVPRW